MNPDKFKSIWNNSDTLSDAATDLEMSKTDASAKASKLRKLGIKLKLFKSQPQGKPAYMPTLEEIWEVETKKIREQGFYPTGNARGQFYPPWSEHTEQGKLRPDWRNKRPLPKAIDSQRDGRVIRNDKPG